MRWEDDLLRDIRFGDKRDDVDQDVLRRKDNFGISIMPTWSVPPTDFSRANGRALVAQMNSMAREPMTILEIGVDRSQEPSASSTSVFLNYKHDRCIYLGIDKNDREYLNDPEKNIHTLVADSGDYETVRAKMKEIGMESIDVFLIDGWHSINQVLTDWEYSDILSEDGMVVFHDTRCHPGPHLFVKSLDQNKWRVIHDACKEEPADWGIGFAWKRKLL